MTSERMAFGAAPAGIGAEPLQLSWKQPSGLIGLSFVNFILRILTLGFYHFWGKTEVRRRIWSAVRLNGEPLEYTGTGKELFLGFLVVFAVVVLPVMLGSVVVAIAFGPQSPAIGAFQTLLYVAFFFLLGIGMHRALRYRLSRTRWRGIRGGLEGSSLSFAWTHFWTALLIPPTLGWIMPWRTTKLQGLLSNDMRFGSRPFRFTANSGPLYRRFAILWVCAIVLIAGGAAAAAYVQYLAATDPQFRTAPGQLHPTLIGIIALVALGAYIAFSVFVAWYRAVTINHFAAHTAFEGATFRGNATVWSLIWLTISNMLIVFLTLGLLAPVAQARSARYLVQRLSIEGTVPLGEILQRAEDPMQRGEGISQILDVDAF